MAVQFLQTAIYLGASTLVILATMGIFLMLTRYNDWEEIKKGNTAAAMALGGKIFGVGNVMHYAIMSNSTLLDTIIWGCAGMALMLLVYLAFEWLTPKLSVNDEIASGNRAVGLLSLVFSVTFSFVIGASIS